MNFNSVGARIDHLGGHSHKTWIDEGAFLYVFNKFNIKSMIDIGCGPGGMKKIAQKYEISWVGIDGDYSIKDESIINHDFNLGRCKLKTSFDLGWSVEFLEHVRERYLDNVMFLFNKCKYVICTTSVPGSGGYYHVNEQPKEYWIKLFLKYDLIYNYDITIGIKQNTTMRKKHSNNLNWMEQSGMFFERK